MNAGLSNDEFIACCLGDDPRRHRIARDSPASVRTGSLAAACCSGESSKVRELIAADPTSAVCPCGPHQRPPLLYVCFSRLLTDDSTASEGFIICCRLLLEHGADPNSFYAVNNDPNARQTALYGAAGLANNAAITDMLLTAGADPNDGAPGPGPESLYHAAEFQNPECLRLILQAGPDRDKVSYCLGRMLDFENPEGVRLFLEHGADPNYRIPRGHQGTRLHAAIRERRSGNVISALLDAGADVSAEDAHGNTPLALAVRAGLTDIAGMLLSAGARESEASEPDRLLGRAATGDIGAAGAQTADTLQRTDRLNTDELRVLPEAAMAGHVAAVRGFLQFGIPVDTIGPEGMNAAHWAAWKGRADLLETVLQFRPDPELLNQYGGTVLGAAVYGSVFCTDPFGGHVPGKTMGEDREIAYADIVRMLLKYGADPSVLTNRPCRNPHVESVLSRMVG